MEAAGLTKIYGRGAGGFRAVDALTLSVALGELFGFLGPNGAGKTTTIKMLVGLLRPSAGTARIAGFDLQAQAAQAKQRTGYVPDNPFLYDKLTGREFLDFVADLYALPVGQARRERAEGLLRLLDMETRGDQLVGGYSRGMRQKLALAAALLHEPQALFLDEPTVGLDPGSVRRLKDILRAQCRERGAAVFLSTHTLEVASEICDRVGIFHRGRLIAQGSPAALSARAPSGRLEDVFLTLTADSPALETSAA
ncbi:MAG: ABC transporter ATP-binding protein [Armatimonadetes bacterium]|nr:ABC transporter ATP-binding protein [Armatimonadota bacterium]